MQLNLLEALERRLADPAPGMLCTRVTGSGPATLIAPVTNSATPQHADWRPPLDLCGEARVDEDAWALYRRYRSFHLYNGIHPGPLGIEEGFKLYDTADWAKETKETVDQWADWYEDDSFLPYGRNDFVAIGLPGGSFTPVHLVVRGPCAGRVFYSAWTSPPETADDCYGRSLSDFLHFVFSTDPVELLNDFFGCHSSYSDGTEDSQYVPEKYLPDRRTVETA